jgi:hypothetical protein
MMIFGEINLPVITLDKKAGKYKISATMTGMTGSR